MISIIESIYQKDYRNFDFPFNAAISTLSSDSSYRWHWHEEYEILVCLEDYFTIGINNQFYVLQKHEIIIIKGNSIHCTFYPKHSRHLVIKFNSVLLRNCPHDFSILTSLDLNSTFWDEKIKKDILHIILEMYKEFDKKRKGYRSSICSKLLELQTYVIRHLSYPDNATVPPKINAPSADSVICSILLYISAHYKTTITLADCARHFGFNPNYFSSFFSKSTGITFHKYLTILRLREFEYLLTTTEYTITDICYRSGFSNIKTAYRTFKMEWGCSPTEYRLRNKMNFSNVNGEDTSI